MKRKAYQNTNIKWIVLGLVFVLSLVWFAGCGTDNGDSKESKTAGITQEEEKNEQDGTKDTAAGQDDSATADEKAGDDTNTGTGTDGTNTSNDGTTAGSSGADSDTANTPATPESTCTIQINCNLLVGKDLTGTGLAPLVPGNGVILGTTKVTLNPGDTVYDVTLRVTKAKKIHMASQGSQAMGNLYIAAISNIYEKAYNSKSGWVYLINGAQPGIGCGERELKSGDKLVWAYSLDMGNDL